MTQQQNAWQNNEGQRNQSSAENSAAVWQGQQESTTTGIRRTRKTPVTIHNGFGFGAGAVRERSRYIARQSNEHRESRVKELLSEPVATPHSQPPPTNTAAKQAQMPQPNPTPTFSAPARSVTKPVSVPMVSTRPKSQIGHSTQPTKEVIAPVGVGRAMLGWILDGTVAISAFVLAVIANLVFLPNHNVKLASEILRQIGRVIHVNNAFALTVIMRVGVLTAAILFAVQFLMFVSARASAGRFAVGMSMQKGNFGVTLVNAMFGALSEVVTLGGLLSLPLVALMPSRVPLFPWMRFGIPQQQRQREQR